MLFSTSDLSNMTQNSHALHFHTLCKQLFYDEEFTASGQGKTRNATSIAAASSYKSKEVILKKIYINK